jgi:hypothetical protein
VNLRVIVATELILLFGSEFTKRNLEVSIGVLGTHDMTDLTRGVSRDAGVSVFDLRVKVLTEILDLSDKRKMEPHALTLSGEDTLFGKSILQQLEKVRTEERFSRTIRVRGVSDNDIVLVNLVL